MTLIQMLESRREALKVKEIAELLGVSDKHIYEMVADGALPALHIGRSIRFDPQDVADWLRKKRPADGRHSARKPEKQNSVRRSQNGKESTSGDRIWRQRINSLEAALAIDSSSNCKTTENS